MLCGLANTKTVFCFTTFPSAAPTAHDLTKSFFKQAENEIQSTEGRNHMHILGLIFISSWFFVFFLSLWQSCISDMSATHV